jgi:hypothetical protein
MELAHMDFVEHKSHAQMIVLSNAMMELANPHSSFANHKLPAKIRTTNVQMGHVLVND